MVLFQKNVLSCHFIMVYCIRFYLVKLSDKETSLNKKGGCEKEAGQKILDGFKVWFPLEIGKSNINSKSREYFGLMKYAKKI